jgi:hypothetical protein
MFWKRLFLLACGLLVLVAVALMPSIMQAQPATAMVMATSTAVSPPGVTATPTPLGTAPVGYCQGEVGWPLAMGEEAEFPACGLGTTAADVSSAITWHYIFTDALKVVTPTGGTLWHRPAISLTEPLTFCQGLEAWPLSVGDLPLNAACGPGTYAVDKNSNLAWTRDFTEAQQVRQLENASFWFKPAVMLSGEDREAFCSNEQGWLLDWGQIPVDPDCGPGRYAIATQGVVTPLGGV